MPTVDPQTLGSNLYLLIGGFVCAGFSFVLLITLWVAVKYLRSERERVKAERELRAEKYRPDGEPYPPAAAGFCDRCQQAQRKVYHLPSGRRLCPGCYEVEEMPSTVEES